MSDELTTNCLLNCGCHRILAGRYRRIGEILYCIIHQRTATIVSNLPEYKAKCLNCRYSRRFGQAKLTALTKGTAHSIRYRHRVNVYHGTKLEEEIGRSHQLRLAIELRQER